MLYEVFSIVLSVVGHVKVLFHAASGSSGRGGKRSRRSAIQEGRVKLEILTNSPYKMGDEEVELWCDYGVVRRRY